MIIFLSVVYSFDQLWLSLFQQVPFGSNSWLICPFCVSLSPPALLPHFSFYSFPLGLSCYSSDLYFVFKNCAIFVHEGKKDIFLKCLLFCTNYLHKSYWYLRADVRNISFLHTEASDLFPSRSCSVLQKTDLSWSFFAFTYRLMTYKMISHFKKFYPNNVTDRWDYFSCLYLICLPLSFFLSLRLSYIKMIILSYLFPMLSWKTSGKNI